MKKHSFKQKERSGAHTVVFGVIVSAASLLILSLFASVILILTKDPLGSVGAASLAALVLSAALSAFLTVRFKGEGALLPSLISALIAGAMIILISLISDGGNFGAAIMNSLSFLLPSALVTVLATRKRSKPRGRFR